MTNVVLLLYHILQSNYLHQGNWTIIFKAFSKYNIHFINNLHITLKKCNIYFNNYQSLVIKSNKQVVINTMTMSSIEGHQRSTSKGATFLMC
jgi:hypothetical protein